MFVSQGDRKNYSFAPGRRQEEITRCNRMFLYGDLKRNAFASVYHPL
ncbi:unnamed protein product [Salmonella enterica subsp. enterica serovar Typhimurium str. DT2]|nr:unnamed protein product [Salmonella enterica subsp. enterica serovar Typhimurium str. DT2]